ncbi:MAG: PLP-dependent transferase [Ignavibacteriaceae bacterium]
MSADKKNPDKIDSVGDTIYSMDTHLIDGINLTKEWDYSHHVLPHISSSVIYRLDSVESGAEGFYEFTNTTATGENAMPIYIYDRLGEPNKEILEENLAYLSHTRTLIEHPASMTHSMVPFDKLIESGIDPGGIRVAIGLENVNDILSDLEGCLKVI